MAVVAVVCLTAGACSRSTSPTSPSGSTASRIATATTEGGKCNTPLQATDVGISSTDITIEVMADVGSPLAPGLFQGNIDAIKGFAAYVNAHGGIACRQLVVRTWDSKLDPTESKNGQIDACPNALAMVGTNALFNPDVSPMTNCVDKFGHATGLPDLPAVTADVNEECAPTAYPMQSVPDRCPITPGVRPQTEMVGPLKWALQQDPGLHGLFMVAGDLPSTVQVDGSQLVADQQAGMVWDGTPKVSGADSQAAYTPRVELAKAKGSTFVYDGSNDIAMIRMRKEALAQGLTSVKVWECTIACYTQAFLAEGGSAVEGTYVWLPFLPFEEASYNAEDQNYVNTVGLAKVDSFGAGAWQAAVAFQTAINTIVVKSGVNGITRATLLQALDGLTNFSANGWAGPKALKPGGYSPCMMIMQVQNGKFVRVYPIKPGTLDCNPSNILTVNLNPVAEAATLK